MKKYISRRILRSIGEGGQIPRFYLPVLRPANRDAYECWIFPLAPFVLAYYILRNVFWSIWRDLLDVLWMLEIMNKLKHEK